MHMSGCFDAAVEKLEIHLREQEPLSFKTLYLTTMKGLAVLEINAKQ